MSDDKNHVEPIEADIASRCAACELEYATGSQYVNHTCRTEVAPSRSAATKLIATVKCSCGHMHGEHAEYGSHMCRMAGCDCQRFESFAPASAATPSEREAAQRELKDYDPHATEGESEAFICGFLRGVEARAAVPQAAAEPEELAKDFHYTYERLAPSFGYETRKESAKPWAEVPEKNRKLMIAVCASILEKTRAAAVPAPGTPEVSLQSLLDAGFNGFAVQLLAECLTRKKDFDTWEQPICFLFRGVRFTLEKERTGATAPPKGDDTRSDGIRKPKKDGEE